MLRRPRPIRGVLPQREGGGISQQTLQRAHRLMQKGSYMEAALIFERLAQGAQARGFLGRAPFLYLQAGRARLAMGQVDAGMVWFRQSFDLFVDTGRFLMLHRIGGRIVDELILQGNHQAAQEVNQWLTHALEKHPDVIINHPEGDIHRPSLPVKCPQCGASVRPDEVDWIDSNIPSCAYCGSILESG
jgi:hypothetical protein